MRIEHAAYQVADPVGAARWYVTHLAMTVKRAETESPFGHFLADSGGGVMLEFYNNPNIQVPDYRRIDPLVAHIAFSAEDVAATRERLVSAGANAEGDVQINSAGDQVAMLRDPWGLPLQLVRRSTPMIK